MGIDVLIGIARFLSQRVSFSPAKNQYVMLGVTGPNEYENNINNNWYTNYLAQWCLKYTVDSLKSIEAQDVSTFKKVFDNNKLKESEMLKWQNISSNMYLHFDEDLGVYLQQDGFLDKEYRITVDQLSRSDRPINQKWSWDRILRSPYIKQADVMQGFYFF